MKKLLKKYTALLLSFILVLCNGMTVFASEAEEQAEENASDMMACEEEQQIWQQGQDRILALNINGDLSDADRKEAAYNICEEVVGQLNALGNEAYVVNGDNYDELEGQLDTDLSELGITREGNYIVSISGESASGGAAVCAEEGTVFTYEYDGVTYYIRYVTVTAADDSRFVQTDQCDLLQTYDKTVIENCLNTAVTAAVDAITGRLHLGTIASILGFDITKFGIGGQTTMVLHGGANWTRVFTQVYLPNSGGWMNGSCVEYVQTYSYVSGLYYDAETNRMEQLPQQERRETFYSVNYSDYAWRKRTAVIYAKNANGCSYDMTDDAKIYYGDKKKFTFAEYF